MNEIKKILDSCISILKTIRIDYNTSIGPRTSSLLIEIKKLIPLLEKEEPYITSILKQSLSNIVLNGTFINAYVFGDIRTALNILDNIYSHSNKIERKSKIQGKKIFISHSSKDKSIVEKFVDHILLLGIGMSIEDVFCTSIEDSGIKNGEDIRKHIQDNIRCADYSFLFISNNYKASEICLNEMGAVWAYNNKVRYYLLPDSNFDTIGWLCNPNQAEKLFDSISLDTLHTELIRFYSLEDKGTTWSRQRETFLKVKDIVKKEENIVETIKVSSNVVSVSDRRLDVNVKELSILEFLRNNPNVSKKEISENFGISMIAVNRIISSLMNKGVIEREGTTHNFQWIVKI